MIEMLTATIIVIDRKRNAYTLVFFVYKKSKWWEFNNIWNSCLIISVFIQNETISYNNINYHLRRLEKPSLKIT